MLSSMAAYCFPSASFSSSSYSPSSTCKTKISPRDSIISSLCLPPGKQTFSLHTPFSKSSSPYPKKNDNHRPFTVLALAENEQQQFSTSTSTTENGYSLEDDYEFRNSLRSYELSVCNLPTTCGISELLSLFNLYGTVQSIGVPRNVETGISRGVGYVTMSSLNEANAAVAALDGTDVDGSKIQVRFSVDVNGKSGRQNPRPTKNMIFETPYKIYVGNLPWSVQPEDLRSHFSHFGNVVSTKVLHDRKNGKSRVYGFLSFSSCEELEAAMSLHGTDFCGRELALREVAKQNVS